MTPNIVKIQELQDKVMLSSLENKSLKAEIKFFKRLLFLVVFAFFAVVIITLCFNKKYTLGKAVLDSGICVEYDMGYACETPDNHIFIEK